MQNMKLPTVDSKCCLVFQFLLPCSVLCGCCSTVAIIGETVRLDCNPSTRLDMKNIFSEIDTVVWEHEDEIIIDHSSKTVEMYQGKYYSRLEENTSLPVLEIQEANFNDSGMYTCLIFFESESSDVIGLTPWILSILGTVKQGFIF